MEVTPSQSKWTLCTSNLFYLVPAAATIYKMSKSQINPEDGSSLVIMFLFVAFLSSWSYHSCRADLTIQSKININSVSASISNINRCAECPENNMSWIESIPGSHNPMTFEISRFIDHLTAILALVLVLVQVLPLHDKIRKLVILLSILWLVLFLSCGNEMVALVPAFLSLLLLFIFWGMTWVANSTSRNVVWMIGLVLLVSAVYVFKIDDEPYWIKHSLWHIFGALSATCLIMKTATCYNEMNLSKVWFPTTMEKMFTSPYFCDKRFTLFTDRESPLSF